MVDQDSLISYGGCGIPYFISGDVSTPKELQSTSFYMLRDEKFFREAKDIAVMTNTKAVAIDRQRQEVLVQHVVSGVRSYEAQVTLDQVGIRDTCNLQGGNCLSQEMGPGRLRLQGFLIEYRFKRPSPSAAAKEDSQPTCSHQVEESCLQWCMPGEGEKCFPTRHRLSTVPLRSVSMHNTLRSALPFSGRTLGNNR
jgi:hypothetical protein